MRQQGGVMRRVSTFVWSVMLVIVPAIASAQIGGSGSIQGTVLDTSKGTLPGATVTATNIATGIDTVRQTTDAGVYVLAPLPAGTYRVTVTLAGFQTFVREGVIVDALTVVGLNITLPVGPLTQEVAVVAETPQ